MFELLRLGDPAKQEVGVLGMSTEEMRLRPHPSALCPFLSSVPIHIPQSIFLALWSSQEYR